MAKKIFVTQKEFEAVEQAVQQKLAELKQKLTCKKFGNANEKYTIDFDMNKRDNRTATILFTPKAWIKMQMLVRSFSSEVEWHGTVERVDNSTFVIKDILIFPHEVTGVTVTSDQDEYEAWLDSLDDETFNKLRFHGHSHVNMAVTPSGTDMEYRHSVLKNCDSNTFFIFLIVNKSGDMSAEIYDLQGNALYSTQFNEISIEVIVDDGEYLNEFELEAKKMVRPKAAVAQVANAGGKNKNKKGGNGTPYSATYVTPYARIAYHYGGYYGGWNDDEYGE